MTPEEHKAHVETLKRGVLATALAKSYNCAERLQTLIDKAYYRATRSDDRHIQGKLSEASLKLSELIEIMKDPQMQELIVPENELPEFMKNLGQLSEE